MTSMLPSLPGLDDLVFVEQEDRDTGCGDQLVDLRPAAFPHRPGCEPVDGCLPNPMGLVADQYVEAVLLGVHEAVEVLEHRLHSG